MTSAALTQRADFHGIAGNLVMPGFTAPKIERVRDNEPRLFNRIARVLLPKDYVRLVLTGDYVSDLSDSAGTLWLDVARRCCSDELLAATDSLNWLARLAVCASEGAALPRSVPIRTYGRK